MNDPIRDQMNEEQQIDHIHTNPAVIYFDGSCRPNPGRMGIGVYCQEPFIRIHKTLDHGTCNQAECLAAIEALEHAHRLGLKNVQLLSDSKLVVFWATGKWKMKSATAKKYVPRIKSLLEEVHGQITWIPRSKNLADAIIDKSAKHPSKRSIDWARIDPYSVLTRIAPKSPKFESNVKSPTSTENVSNSVEFGTI